MKLSTLMCALGLCAWSAPTLAAKDLYEELKSYFASSIPGEAFIPNPYGADSRFAPRTIWVYLDSAQKSGTSLATRKQSAWFVMSSGASIYSDDLAPVQRSPINLPTRDQDLEKKIAISAALAGKLLPKDVEAALKLAQQRNLSIDVSLPESEIAFCYYEDMLAAQEIRKAAGDKLTNRLRAKYAGTLPPRRVITAAIRVKGATITVDADKTFDFSANAEVKALLSNIGFSWNSKSQTFDSLQFSDWRYIAYQALMTDSDGRISTAGNAGLDQSRESNTLPVENRSGELP